MRTVGILVASDQGSRGERVDQSGALIEKMMVEAGFEVIETRIVPDEKEQIAGAIVDFCDVLGCHVVLTTGGPAFQSETSPQKPQER